MSRAAKTIAPIKATPDTLAASVFSSERKVKTPSIKLADSLRFNTRLKMDGLQFLGALPAAKIPVAFFDPQYRGILDKMGYGNEGEARGKARCSLEQMTDGIIKQFISGIDHALMPSGHLFLWIDKYHLCSGFADWLIGTRLDVVNMLTWDKGRIGMGYRTRRMSEHLAILQKQPRRAKGVWKIHTIPDVWQEGVKRNGHAHKKPIDLQGELMAAVTNGGDVVIDPAAGSFSVMESCRIRGRNFLGCDING